MALVNRGSNLSWKELLQRCCEQGLHAVEFVVSKDPAGVGPAIQEVSAVAVRQRCRVQLLRRVLYCRPRKIVDDCLME